MKISKEQFLAYYELGLSDPKISELTGEPVYSLQNFRRQNNLPSHGWKAISDDDLLELYNKGLEDWRIAAVANASREQVVRFRRRHGLVANKKKHPLDDVFLELYNAGNNDFEISCITGISKSTVQNYRSKLGLPVKDILDDNKLIELFNLGMSDEEIANELNRSADTIRKNRTRLKLWRADHRPNNYVYSDSEFQVILGSLLGDGSLIKTHVQGGTTLSISHCIKQKEYLEYKWNLLKNNAHEIRERKRHDARRRDPDYTDYLFYTKSSLSLNELYYNWYVPNKRINKDDLYKIEPLGLAIWYMDDGYKVKPYGGAMLSTNCFSRQELLMVQEMFLTKFNIKTTLMTQENLLYIPTNEFEKFVQLIKPHMTPSMMYKIESRCKTPLNGETPVDEQDNPVLNPQEIEENAERLEVMP